MSETYRKFNMVLETSGDIPQSELDYFLKTLKGNVSSSYLIRIESIEEVVGTNVSFKEWYIKKFNGDSPTGSYTDKCIELAWDYKQKKIKESNSIIDAIEFHGCLTGDCPHDTKTECYMELIKLPNLIDRIRKEN